ncbi:T9SS type A sorting domain-containing protein [Lewinella sp. JB7]|uniref:T9SS type A sorting domain-containing protein n=1 Tax=Lewinella sp. JB7 TaxID=2962887 RepID=UPI0020C950F1|nr:T9SS type A sorting domain-containing protein [Lewinella sp. JB7]MCP9236249.1 T9SS type A sorting domain-containing protein [Lewinella sp. JB7]
MNSTRYPNLFSQVEGRRFTPRWAPLMLVLSLLLTSLSLQATHFRYGSLSWRHLTGTTVEFQIEQAWRTGFFFSGTPAIGTVVTVDALIYGDGTSDPINLTVTAVDEVDGWFFGRVTLTHTYPTQAAYSPYYSSCCRIGGIVNASGGWYVTSLVDLSPGLLGNDSPVTSINPIVNVPQGATATFNLPATDPDGDAIRYRLAGSGETSGIDLSPLSVSATGQVTVDISGAGVNALYSVPVIVEDLDASGAVKSAAAVDFFVRVVQPSNPPGFDYTVTPADNTVLNVRPGEAVSFTVRASDTDPGSTVTLNAVGVPPGASFTPQLPTSGNPVQSTFNWTPGSANQGANVINVTATDDLGNQTATAISIVVSQRPIFDVPPTPPSSVFNVVAPGDSLSFTVQASDADSTDLVSITAAKKKSTGTDFTALGGMLSPALPTPAANPTSTVASWAPGAADWGLSVIVFTAVDSSGESTPHEVPILVNTNPMFTSMPDTTATVGALYSYLVMATDADLPYGDALEIVGINLPAWLTLTDNGDGTALLSGVPGPGDAGSVQIELEAHDIYHHQNVGGIPQQTFTIAVGGGGGGVCTITLDSVATTGVTCPGADDGTLTAYASGSGTNYTYSIDGPLADMNTTGTFTGLPGGMYTVSVSDDDTGGCTDTLMNVEVPMSASAPPVIVDITVPDRAQYIGQILKGFVTYTDADDHDDHTATIDWGDGVTEKMSVKQLLNKGDAQHRYFQVGTYTVHITVTDGCGNSVTEQSGRDIVVYDPNAGAVVGGGWLLSPGKAYLYDPMPGIANFGFKVEYEDGKYKPTGHFDFFLNPYEFYFSATRFETLSVDGHRFRFTGSGQVKGTGDYRFIVSGEDGEKNSSGFPFDKLRIIIIDNSNDDVVYDNLRGIDFSSHDAPVLVFGRVSIRTADDEDSEPIVMDPPGTLPVNSRLADKELAESIVYPNPASSEIKVDWEGFTGDTRVVLVDQTGRIVLDRIADAEAGSLRLDLQALNLTDGMYLLRLTDGDRDVNHQIVIHR